MNIFDILDLILLLITLSNIFIVKTIRIKNSSNNFNFDILVPLRNEERNVRSLMQSLLSQGGNILVLNDQSSDGTTKELEHFENEIQIFNGKDLPKGWLGKNFACHQLAIQSKAKYLVFIDADVRLKKGAISNSIEFLEKNGWDFISPYPRQKTSSLLQFLIQPLLQWSWFATIPFAFAYKRPNRSMAVANGQFFIIRRDAYLQSGGHKSIKGEVLDDIELARALISHGFKGGPVDGSQIADCHMYQSDQDLISGYTKSLWRAFGSPLGSLIAIAFIFATLLPFYFLTAGAIFVLLSRFVVSLKVKSNPLSSILHPFSMAILILLIGASHSKHRFGRLSWRGRIIN